MGPKSGLGMSGRLEVHRIPAGVQDRRVHNKHLLLPVMSHVSEVLKEKEAGEMGKNWNSPETWKLPSTLKQEGKEGVSVNCVLLRLHGIPSSPLKWHSVNDQDGSYTTRRISFF